MKKIWLESYPPGTPAEVDIRPFRSLAELFTASCALYRDRVAFTNMGVSLTYGEIDRLSADFGAYLQHELRLHRGDRIAIMLPNVLQYPIALFGALRVGLVVVNVNPLYTASELEHPLADSGARAIVVLDNFAHTLEKTSSVGRLHVITSQLGDLFPPVRRALVNATVKYVKRMVPRWRIAQALPFRAALDRGADHTLSEVALRPEDLAFLQYTGGTTGRPKGAMLTHGNLVANVEQTIAWIGAALKAGEETVVTALPLYHIFALTANLLLFLRLGGTNLLITNARDLGAFVSALGSSRFTAITGVSTLYGALLDAPGFDAVCAANRGALKIAVAGGMAVQRSVAERWQAATGIPLIEGYGLTEASPNVCCNRFDTRTFSGTLGLPMPSTEVAILDEEGNEMPPGEMGEICVHGPQVMQGYWKAPEETARAFIAAGWLRTGDIGSMDAHGYVRFHDRRKDVIVVSGFKAYPAEIEDVAKNHPDVRDAGAVGVPDARSGESVVLFVVKRDPRLTASELLEYCARHLTGYKLPRRIEFRSELPKTPIGKISRRTLREEAARARG